MKPVAKGLAAFLILLGVPNAEAFDFARYQAMDLDTVLQEKRPETGADLHDARPLKLSAALVAYGQPCETGFLKRSMIASGIPAAAVDAATLTQCIRIRSAGNKVLRVFIQDQVAAFLPKEVPLGRKVTFYVNHLFTDRDGPGLLVNEFLTGDEPGKPDPARAAR